MGYNRKEPAQSSEQPPKWEAVHTGTRVKLSVDQEQDAGNDGTDARDQVHHVSAQADPQKSQASDDQIYSKQDPFKATHFLFLLLIKWAITKKIEVDQNRYRRCQHKFAQGVCDD